MMMSAAKRIGACIEASRLRRALRRAAIAGTRSAPSRGMALHASLRTLPRRAVCKATAFAAIVIATLLAFNALIAAADAFHDTSHISATPRNCSARYAALLDLAELARRDGNSSELVVRGLSEQGGALSECLPVARSGPMPR